MNQFARRLRTPEERVGGLPNASLPPPAESVEDAHLLRALALRDEAMFARSVELLYPSMLRLALQHVGSEATAEEVVQETWLAALRGIGAFEGRSAVKTWLFQILRNIARRRGRRDARMRPLSDIASARRDANGSATVPDVESLSSGDGSAPQALWATQSSPEADVLSRELGGRIEAAIGRLPERMREVIVLRDVEGWSADEVCNILGITDTNQRVLLHRARNRVRDELREYLEAEECDVVVS